jgi:pyruvate formate lyase activating enzyme
VRQASDSGINLTAYGRCSGFCVDPIEKKPLNHFFPGTEVLSFGTVGCNLACQFCQNWPISQARRDDRLRTWAEPEDVAAAAAEAGCRSVAFTYNEPIISAEYLIDCALACRQLGIKTVAVTAGYVTATARPDVFRGIDAANIDLKAFDDTFYRQLCGARLSVVLDTIEWAAHQAGLWLELTTLLIPGRNDAPQQVERLCQWILTHVGADVPLHFSAFHPDYRLTALPTTPSATLTRARAQARELGLHHVYSGNVRDPACQSTFCPGCRSLLIERAGYEIGEWQLTEQGCCPRCGRALAGVFGHQPSVTKAVAMEPQGED